MTVSTQSTSAPGWERKRGYDKAQSTALGWWYTRILRSDAQDVSQWMGKERMVKVKSPTGSVSKIAMQAKQPDLVSLAQVT